MDPITIGLGLSSLFGGLFGNKSESKQQPTLDPAYGPLQQLLLQRIQQRLSGPSSLPANYETGGIQSINKTYDPISQGLNANLTARGLSTSPVAAPALERLARARAGDIGSFRSNIPLVSRQLENQDFDLASGLLNMGRGQSMTGSTGGGFGGGFDSLMTMLGYLYGKGAFGQGGNGLPGYTKVPG